MFHSFPKTLYNKPLQWKLFMFCQWRLRILKKKARNIYVRILEFLFPGEDEKGCYNKKEKVEYISLYLNVWGDGEGGGFNKWKWVKWVATKIRLYRVTSKNKITYLKNCFLYLLLRCRYMELWILIYGPFTAIATTKNHKNVSQRYVTTSPSS